MKPQPGKSFVKLKCVLSSVSSVVRGRVTLLCCLVHPLQWVWLASVPRGPPGLQVLSLTLRPNQEPESKDTGYGSH